MKGNWIWYNIANFLAYMVLYIIGVAVILHLVNNIIIRVIMFLALFIICGYIEERILSRFVNDLVMRLLSRK